MFKKIKKSIYGISLKTFLAIGFSLAISLGSLDITYGFLSKPHGYRLNDFSFIISSATVTAIFFFCLFSFFCFLLKGVKNVSKIALFPFAFSLAVFTGVIYLLALYFDILTFSPSFKNLRELFLFFIIALIISTASYFLAKVFSEKDKKKSFLRALILSLPFLIFETMTFLWAQKYLFISSISIIYAVIYTAFILSIAVTYLLFFYKDINDNFLMVSSLMLLMIVSTIASFFFVENASHDSAKYVCGEKKIKHIILITADALRSDALSCYGNKRIVTDNLDALAKDSLFFENAVSPSSWTLPSLTSINTGVSSTVHLTMQNNSGLSDKFMTLAEYFSQENYLTGAVVRSVFLKPLYNLAQGFDDYYQFPREFPSSLGPRILRKLPYMQFRFDVSTDYSTTFAKQWIESNKENAFFLWIHYIDPHSPYKPPERYLAGKRKGNRDLINYDIKTAAKVRNKKLIPTPEQKKWIRILYEGEVLYLDDYIGDLLEYLKTMNLYDSSLIIFTSDHGEEFWEHGGVEHMHTLYNELLSVPLIIKLPNSSVKKNINTPVSNQRIMSTILELCGIKPNSKCYTAKSLVSLWQDTGSSLSIEPIISIDNFKESIIFDGIKYIKYHKPEKEVLYDLINDPGETRSIADSLPHYLTTARKILAAHFMASKKIRSCLEITSEKKVDVDNDTLKRLKALGYMN